MGSCIPSDAQPLLPAELLGEVFAHCPQSDLARASLVNHHILEISRDSLYSKICVSGDAHLSPILPALRNPDIARRLRHVALDPNQAYEKESHLDEFLDIICSSSLVRLDLIAFNGMGYSSRDWMHPILIRLTQLPQLQHLKLALSFIWNSEITSVLQTRSLKDLDVSDPRLLKSITSGASTGSSPLPVLDTLRIRNSAGKWTSLLEYIDISRMTRLALWDYEKEMGDLKFGWGRLVTASAPTLESLSLWLTSNITDQDIPGYLESVAGFPVLHTLTLFITIDQSNSHLRPLLWIRIFLPIITAFHASSPSLRHIRCYVHAWDDEYTYQVLLQNVLFAELAHEVVGLKYLETIEFSFRHSHYNSMKASATEQSLLNEMFHPVHPSVEYGVSWNYAWPFFGDDRPTAEWAKFMATPAAS
ncbi:hypothetical protein DL96DRAFT_1610194 [Flagelloscypha sp. PMI_526]|nr:hypothetical protein DL96DRAFT_1610194 [Flagelloscypha sp. PMI_526]